ncbi:MAG: hypothetical protein HC877_07930 [Thioploca sp.]|nr:hypothetical protein [Thioploca sp.]
MKNSFYFNSPSMTKSRNSTRLVFLLVLLLMLISYIAIPQVINSAPIAAVENSTTQVVKVIPLPDLNKIKMAQQQVESEQEVAYLLHQQYLDPLAKYIDINHLNEAKTPYVEKVKMELTQRCSEVENRYQSMKTARVTLRNLKQSYGYACPAVVERLTKTLSK